MTLWRTWGQRLGRALGRTAALLLTPVHALAVFTGDKSFAPNPILGSVRLNRRGLHVWRVIHTHATGARRRRALEALVSPEDKRAYEADGFVVKRDLLPESAFAALKAEVLALSVSAREMTEGETVTRQISITGEVLKAAPALRALLQSPAWRGLIAYVGSFDAAPLINVQTILAKTAAGPADPQTDLHMDTFHPTAKAWFFLDDVGPDDGPLAYVPGSHRASRRRLAWQKRISVLKSRRGLSGGSFRVSPGQLARLGLPAPTRFTVPANTLVVADTFGFHARTASPRPTVRIEIYASLRPNPFNPLARLGPRGWRLPQGLKETAGWLATDLLAALGLARPVWKTVTRRPGDAV